MEFKPTDEQVRIIDAASTGENMVIEAGAGTGKTSTLKLLSKRPASKSDRLLYIAYNRAIKDDAQKSFPSNTKAMTAHGLAFGAVGKNYTHRLKTPRMTGKQVAWILGIKGGIKFGDDATGVYYGPDKLGRLAAEAVQRFCYSAAEEIHWGHIPFLPGMEEHYKEIAQEVIPYARKAWADIQKRDGRLKFVHDHYLKMWALTNPRLNWDVILFDEAQDANPVISDLVLKQAHAQLIAVGDRNQAIYGWRGAEDAMQTWPAKHRLYLSQSFRFGPAVADEANKWLTLLDAPLRLSGYDQIPSQVVQLHNAIPGQATLCRTNAQAIAEAMEAQTASSDNRVHIVGGTKEIIEFTEAAQQLRETGNTDHPDLVMFPNWNEVKKYVEEDSGGADLKVFVTLIDTHGTDRLLEAARACVRAEDNPTMIVSTAHKAKGREWDYVKIASDFKEPVPDPETGEQKPNLAEFMLAYVAVTRAKLALDNTGVAWVDHLLPQPAPEHEEIAA